MTYTIYLLYYLGIILVIAGIGPFHKGCNLTITKYCPFYESTMFNGKVYYAGFHIKYNDKADENNNVDKTTNTNSNNCIKSTIRATNYDNSENCTCSTDNMYSSGGLTKCFDISEGDYVQWYKIKGKYTCNRKIDVENSWWAGLLLMCLGGSIVIFSIAVMTYYHFKNNQENVVQLVDVIETGGQSIVVVEINKSRKLDDFDDFDSELISECERLRLEVELLRFSIANEIDTKNIVEAVSVECVAENTGYAYIV
jgi:hypothetical protein